jgi:glutamate racemase
MGMRSFATLLRAHLSNMVSQSAPGLPSLTASRQPPTPPIGICDWGIGGLGFYNLLRAERPDLDVVYIGDQGVPGYGLFDRKSLTKRIQSVFRTFGELGVEEVIVACNAASTVVDEAQIEGCRGMGIIEPTLASLGERMPGKIGVIGGRRTVRSGSYRRPLIDQGWDVRQRVAQPLSRRIEDGESGTPDTLGLLDQILKPLNEVDLLVLACTHYVVLEQEVRERLPGVAIVDPATEVWSRYRLTIPPKTAHIGHSRFLTTGSARAMERQAKVAFNVDATVEEITI